MNNKIALIKKTPNANVVAMLENILDQARSGEVSGIVIIRSWDDNCTDHAWAGVKDNSVRITGELMVAATSLAKNIDESRI